ncbi:RNA 2',3'-cyclic phosphodiesterase [Hyphococcus luteus]|uniref:RNA 2',3'-cyclic phosphodiesterase n=1 Tax=Hyphococcus luteus TaxID=2058213 RepID=A0A2S7K1X3_9PROT|nr:RNA 2',3'-cyclic phosphodiesterase [Marinicaulis flavus]PQA86509.1 RNA 2',3'-cyclic phosphodiesterase [Marinicaulis flavus]
MHRLFVALEIPEIVADALTLLQSGVDGARWVKAENFHLTLAFIGEADRHGFSAALDALEKVEAPAFDMRLSGVGVFGDRKPHALWAGVAASPELNHLQAKVETALRRAGFNLDKRKFTPHVTLAYLKNVSRDIAEKYAAQHGLFSCGPFPVEAFHLYSSELGRNGAHYAIEASYALSSSR